MLTILAKFFKILNSETDPTQIALALSLALIAGFTPLLSLHNILVLLAVMLLRANLSSFTAGLGVFKLLSFTLDPLFDRLGVAILTAKPLEGLWTSLYNKTVFRLEHFNNSIVMGSLAVSLVIFVPAFFLFRMLVTRYREDIKAWVEKTHLMKALKASRFYEIYMKVAG